MPTTAADLIRELRQREARLEKERDRLQAELRQARKMEAVAQLSGGVARDFNKLLMVIEGNVAVAGRATQTAGAERSRDTLAAALEKIRQAAHRASYLTGQLLLFSRKHRNEGQVLDMSSVVRGMESMLRGLLREDIALTIACDPGEHRIDADRMQIEQVLVNLVVNASDAMPDGGTLGIRVSDETVDATHASRHDGAAAGPHVVITVSDTGVGMDPDTLDHLFEPFFTTKPFGTGTGLGLSIVDGIVREAGGHITVESRSGGGTTFRLYIPAARGELPVSPEPLASTWERGEGTVLLCEDSDSVRLVLRSVLEESGYTVLEAEHGERAVQLAKDHAGAFQLLITDVGMPGMTGDQVAEAILKVQPDVRVLFMSGYASDVLTVENIEERDLDFLQKPFTTQALLQRVQKIVNEAKR